MRIDCQTHVFPPAYVDILAQNRQSLRLEKDGSDLVIVLGDRPTLRIKEGSFDLERKLRDMDQAGIDISILSPNIPGPCMLAPDLAIKGARAMNDYIAGLMERYPGRFAGIASLPWQDVEAAIKEMDRARDELGFCAVMLFSHIGGRPVDDPAFEPAYAHAEKRGLPIVIHPTFPSWGAAIRDHMMIPMIGFQVDSSFALLRLILSGMLERHPGLQILMPHVGGILPYLIGRIDYQTEVMGRARDHITRPPSAYLREIYFDIVSPSSQALQYAYEFSGVDKLLFGTDHPWVEPRVFVDLVEGMNISADEKARIFAGNAKAFFHFP